MVQDTASPGPTKIRAVIVCSGGRNSEGGISRAMDYLATAFEQRPDAPAARIVDPRGTGSLVWSPFFLMRAAAVVAWLFATAKADILHINVSVGASTARKSIIALVARMVGAPYLVHIHSGRYHHFYRGLPRPVRAFTRRMLTRAARVVVLGAGWRAFVIDEVGVDPDRVVVMHNAVPGPAAIERREDASKPPKILFLGRLGQGKGVPELIEALATPRIAALSWTAVLAGDGDIEAYRKATADRGIGDRIAFPGWVGPDTVRELLSSADIMVLPSHHEGLPMSVLEGMAY
ncbi:MAG: glycosyltransferase family 4 protein, partial [Bauldia litoralis]|uniref:glycosyltransferase family 4 protein n=3 Tax=Alphaproteobacteria TaxID=28211 RepID=UPI003296DFD3